jgi:REP element-mobilizing transposase RayT
MARPLRIEYPGAFYHVTARGNEQKDVFKSRKDREQFLAYLESASERYGAVIHAYCLMGNHYHLLLETPEGNLAQIMRHIGGAYTTYFNIKRKRAGHLFQGRYKAILVDKDAYALELSRYIHLNPVRAGIVGRPEDHEWSSYRPYLGLDSAPAWLTTKLVLGCLGGSGAETYRQFVNDSLSRQGESPMMAVVASTILGSPEFVEKIAQRHLAQRGADRNVPAVRRLNRPTQDRIVAVVASELGTSGKLARNVSIYFCHRYSGARLQEIGERFGLSDAAVAQASRRLRIAAEGDESVRGLLVRVAKKLGL